MKRYAASLAIAGTIVAVLSGCAAPEETLSPPLPGPRACNAAAAQSLIGREVGILDFIEGANVRVVCTTCPTTRDYRPDRLNVRFDKATGRVEAVDCG
jgi:hypothetical protein